MEINKIKKALYKENPKATFLQCTKGVMYYTSVLSDGTKVGFGVLLREQGDTSFYPTEDSKLLIRYILTV